MSSYLLHNFQAGTRFYASQANEMDQQIFANAENIESLLATRTELESIFLQHANYFSIVVDSDTIYLKYGDYVLSSASLPLDLSDFVPCSGLVLNDVQDGLILWEGDTLQLSTTVTPVDTSQMVRWNISDLLISTITGSGLLTATGIGPQTVTARCGSQTATLSLSIKRKVNFAAGAQLMGWAQMDASRPMIVIDGTDSRDPAFAVTVPFSFAQYSIPAGRTLYVGLTNNAARVGMRVYVFRPVEGGAITLDNQLEEAANYYRIMNIDLVDSATAIHRRTKDAETSQWGYWGQNDYTYTNNTGGTLYFLVGVQDEGQTWMNSETPLETAKTFLANTLDVIIS